MKNNSVKRVAAGFIAAAVVVTGSIPVSLAAPAVTAQAADDEGENHNKEPLTTGICGQDANGNLADNVRYSFDSVSGTLTISGTREMKNYGNSDSPFFENTTIKNIVIENGVTDIGQKIFCRIDNLTTVTIPDSVETIGKWAFQYCENLSDVKLGSGVKTIGTGAFYSCENLSAITIPDSVRSIGAEAFCSCGSLSVSIPESVEYVDSDAFGGVCNLEYKGNALDNEYYKNWGATTYNGYVDDKGLVYQDITRKTLTACPINKKGTVTIPDSVTSINGAFSGCRSLTNVIIPESVTSIGNWAFSGCRSITTLKIPESVTSIGKSAFDEVTNINYNGDLKPVPDEYGEYWGAKVLNGYIDENGFIYTDKKVLVGCPSGLKGAVVIPDDVTGIGFKAFEGSGLTSVTIPGSVESIGESAFSGCSGLTSIKIPDGVTSIGDDTFCHCQSLTSVTIPNSVESIDYEAFASSGLTSIEIPDSVTSIGDSAFNDCQSLTSLTIPSSVKSLGKSVFNYCMNLTAVKIPDSVTSIGNGRIVHSPDLTISGYEGSAADTFASENNIKFVSIGKSTQTKPATTEPSTPGTGSQSQPTSVVQPQPGAGSQSQPQPAAGGQTPPETVVQPQPATGSQSQPATGDQVQPIPGNQDQQTATDDQKNDDSNKATADNISKVKTSKASISKVSAGKKKLTISAKNVKIKGVKSVRYQYAVRKNGAKSWKKYKSSKKSYTVKKLSSKTKYQVKVRPYVVISGKTYYGKWSAVRTMTVK